MYKKLGLMLVLLLMFILFGCSSNDKMESTSQGANDSTEMMTEDSSIGEELPSNSEDEAANQSNERVEQKGNEAIPEGAKADRKIIYHANLDLEVTDFQGAMDQLEKEINGTGGYIVTSESYQVDNEQKEGTITARIPQEQFDSFIRLVETGDMKVLQKSVSGEDVTEQYVDLESRLKSKQVVEERLLSFMEKAEKTEDLLKISNDLAEVQEEIEQITGRMNYLENKSDLATVTMHIRENRVDIVKDEDLNTWEKVKEQLKKSINFLLSAGSGLIVFLVGNLPVLLIITIAVGFGYFVWKRQRNNRNE
ncbi:hypothetical protein BN1058_02687 [Paraliobacillus sp. PM-2]|uniref:DUF4349 domain-containing protein n=1 Tax=Paraliobacillus sp. PM-2 TaxID=1462524 RepID=UPI00061CA699|nr:DUF4349 domain-containing protein [Paraliobacillus sp. PM-2]CQR48320.1 hypothetical protein BN1058_02687 [Paraliobacillus sp. PM-2]